MAGLALRRRGGLPDQVFPPDADEEQVEEEGAAEMAGSQSVATATALRALGRDVDQTVVIAGVPDGSPSPGASRSTT